jgi:UDP-N-acetyl-D-mannosaminuronic acid dehydrogenase
MTPSISIVGGCGHVGLPLGLAFAQAGAEVHLIDTDTEKVRRVASGRMPFLERGADELLPAVRAAGRLHVTTEQTPLGHTDVVVVTIGTPVDEFLNPGLYDFDAALDGLAARLRPGQLLVLRSTVFPGVTDRLARRLAERGAGLPVAYCPERIAQGYALDELAKLPQIIGGTSPEATRQAGDLFRLLGARILELPPVEAELAKLFCNAYRYINFAVANQFYLIAGHFGADYERIRQAAVADYPRLAGLAGAGFAGGPCLLKDTMQLSAFNHNNFLLGHTAMMINEGLPTLLVEQAKAQYPLAKMTAAILGMAFKGNSDDERSSLSYKLRKVLTLECQKVLCTDPYIADPTFVPLAEALDEADIVFLGACHDEYRDLKIEQPLIDVFRFVESAPKKALRSRDAQRSATRTPG